MKRRLASAALLGAALAILSGCAAPVIVGSPTDPAPVPTPMPGDPAPADPPYEDAEGGDPTEGETGGDPDGEYGGAPVEGESGDEDGSSGGHVIGGGPEDSVVAFQQRCAEGVEEWRDARVDYPDRIIVRIEVGANYNAAIDVRSEPLPPDEVIEVGNGTATSEAVLVKCTIAARLSAVGDALEVDDAGNETDAGWVLQEFTPSGVVEWSWTVTAHQPVDEALRLELRPAIVVDEGAGDLEYAGSSVSSFTTDVHVDASILHHAAHWVDENRPLIWTIGSAIGAAVLAVVLWWRKVRSPGKSRKSTSEPATRRSRSRPRGGKASAEA
jgi:hypothetical protein